MMKIVYLVLLIVLMCSSVLSQVTIDSIFIVDTVHHLFKNSKPSNTYPADIQPGVSTFLSSIASAQLQQSSPGGLTTLLHRGMGTRHLPVLWEGINIQSMVNGSFDLSLIPLHLYSGTQFYSFGSPTLTGSNAIAGALNISTNPRIDKVFLGFSYHRWQMWTYSQNIFTTAPNIQEHLGLTSPFTKTPTVTHSISKKKKNRYKSVEIQPFI